MFKFSLIVIALLGGEQSIDWPPVPDFKTKVDYLKWYEDQIRGDFKPEDNAHELYRKILPGLDDPSVKEARRLGFEGFRHDNNKPEDWITGPWNPDDHPKWERSYQRNKDLLDAFRQATAKPYYAFPLKTPDQGRGPFWLVWLHLSQIRQCTRGLTEAAWRAKDGQIDDAAFLAACKASLAAARQVQREPVQLAQLIAGGIRANVYWNMRCALHYKLLSRAERIAVVEMLDHVDTGPAPYRVGLTGECAAFLGFLQDAMMTESDPQETDDLTELAVAIRSGKVPARPTMDALMKYYKTMDKLGRRPYSREIVRQMESLRIEFQHPDLGEGVNMSPALRRVFVSRAKNQTLRRATRLLYEIHIYHDKHDRWPDRLKDLPEAVLERFGTDPMSGDRLFRYRLVKGQPLLYSVASDSDDDGGKHHDGWGESYESAPVREGDDLRWETRHVLEGDYVFWPIPARKGK